MSLSLIVERMNNDEHFGDTLMEVVVIDRFSNQPAIRIDVDEKAHNVIEVHVGVENNKFTKDKKFKIKVNGQKVLDQTK